MATSLIFDIIGRDSSARRVLQNVADDADNAGKRMKWFGDNASKALSGLGKGFAISSVLATATVGVHSLGGAVVGLGAALAAASGSLLLLPGAAAAGAVAFGALKIATSGFGDALKEIGDPEKFAEAIKKLTPAAQEAAKAVQGLKAPFDELRNSLQEKLFAGLGSQITDVGNKLITTLRPAFESVTTSANSAISSVLTELSSLQSQLQIGLLADNAASAFGNLAAAVRPVVAALLDIATVGASFLPGLTAGAGSAAQRFADMIARMRESGQLATIIQGGLDALSQLGQLLSNIGSIIGSVFGAMNAAGGGALGILVQLTGEARAFLSSAQGQQALTTVFTTIHDTVQALLPGVRALGGALVSAITSIAPALPGLGEAFSAAAQSVAPLVEGLGRLAGTILPPLISAIGFLAPALGPMAAFIGTIVVAVKAWSAAQLLLNLALTANPIGIIVVALGALVAGIALAWHHSETFRNIVTGAWNAIKAVVGAVVGFIVAFVPAAWNAIKAATSAVWNAISGAISSAWNFIKNLVTGAANAVVNFMRSAWDRARSMATGAWNGIVNAVRSGADQMMGFVRSIPGRILGALGNLGSLLYNAGKNIIQGLINGIMSMIGAVGRAIGSVASKVRNALPFSPAKEGPLSGRGSPDIAGRKVVEMLAAGLLARQSQLQAAMARIAGAMNVGGIGVSAAGALGGASLPAPSLAPVTFPAFPVAAARGGQPVRLDIRSDGHRLTDLLVEVLRKAIKDQGGGDVQAYLGR